MPEQLKKIASLLREKAAAAEADKQVKCAQLVQAAVGLEFLKQKIGL